MPSNNKYFSTTWNAKRSVVADGMFYAELNALFAKELAEQGYATCQVRQSGTRTEIIIHATNVNDVLGEDKHRIAELTRVVERRFGFTPGIGAVELYVEKVRNRGLCAQAQAESLRYKLLQGLQVRRACYGVMRYVMESGAKGCEVVVSGKLRAQRAKVMKFKDGYMIKTGQVCDHYIVTAVRNVMMRQGVLGVKVSIMLPYEPNPEENRGGCLVPLSDVITVKEPKADIVRQVDAPAITPALADDAVLDAPADAYEADKPAEL
mmetsp:Transcript_79967/g.162790  ORF Transcript_79967/g.162790 Transcript_79967/m.162790 type:complete len:264 (+) Transcript_79967:84-875(+)